MSRLKKDQLRELTDAERRELVRLSRSLAAPAAEVARAKALLAVADPQAAGARRAAPDGNGPDHRVV